MFYELVGEQSPKMGKEAGESLALGGADSTVLKPP